MPRLLYSPVASKNSIV